jgi:t-SNARE complex subunit (syntaxin)
MEITVNELLSGERLQEVDYKEKAEENMMNLIRKSKATRKERIITAAITIAIIVVALAGGIVGRCFPHPKRRRPAFSWC